MNSQPPPSSDISNAPAVQTPMRCRRPRKRFWIPFALLGLYMLIQPSYRIMLLRQAARDADAVRIVLTEPEDKKRIVVVLRGRDKVDELLTRIALRPSLLGCLCGSMETIEICRGDEAVVKLNVMPEMLWWIRGEWPPTVTLTDASATALQEWMKQKGGSALVKARQANRKLWDEWQTRDGKEIENNMKSGIANTTSMAAN